MTIFGDMRATFREDRATQAAARLLGFQHGVMNVMKLIKLLYLVDRTALVRFGRPVTFDSYVSMDNGPVLSQTLDRINEEPDPRRISYWRKYISERQKYEIRLITAAPNDQLSPAEEALIDEIFGEFGKMDQWQLVDWCHQHLPEWRHPQGSALPIRIRDILLAEGFDDAEAQSVEDALVAEALLDQITK
ncbi:MAG TPA: Panacea domain-containing protein [Gemmatimonadaceae bacterium]|jgi:uncharacterized phage-associated protein